DATASTVEIAGVPRSLVSGVAAADLELGAGLHDIAVKATDAAGNESELTVTVVVDLEAPIVSIDTPLDCSVFGPGEELVAVVATVDDDSTTTVRSIPPGVDGFCPSG